HRLVNQRDLVVLPAGIDIDQAAMLRINPLTAWLLLDAAGVQPGEAVLQNAASSALARWLRFFAAQRGIFVVDVVRRADPELARALVDGPDLAARAKAAAGARPLRAALDCVAGEATGRAAECLAPGGRLMLFGHLSGAPIEVRSQVLTGGGLSVIGFSLRPTEAALGPERVQRLFAELFSIIGDRSPVVPVQTIIPLSNAQAAVAAARAGAKGRVLLDLTA
ncbi:MAG: alcohol dehydrogenase, partial [Sphingomonadales bacterium]|nr:alcohol dehydrogenase [Sphingomonadales bacterium]